jgi:hypothetical protein
MYGCRKKKYIKIDNNEKIKFKFKTLKKKKKIKSVNKLNFIKNVKKKKYT